MSINVIVCSPLAGIWTSPLHPQNLTIASAPRAFGIVCSTTRITHDAASNRWQQRNASSKGWVWRKPCRLCRCPSSSLNCPCCSQTKVYQGVSWASIKSCTSTTTSSKTPFPTWGCQSRGCCILSFKCYASSPDYLRQWWHSPNEQCRKYANMGTISMWYCYGVGKYKHTAIFYRSCYQQRRAWSH